jgi:hypothetical protein
MVALRSRHHSTISAGLVEALISKVPFRRATGVETLLFRAHINAHHGLVMEASSFRLGFSLLVIIAAGKSFVFKFGVSKIDE